MKTIVQMSQDDVRVAVAAMAGGKPENVILRVTTGQHDEQAVTAEVSIESADKAPQPKVANCSRDLAAAGKPYPRTCSACLLGPCKNGYPKGV